MSKRKLKFPSTIDNIIIFNNNITICLELQLGNNSKSSKYRTINYLSALKSCTSTINYSYYPSTIKTIKRFSSLFQHKTQTFHWDKPINAIEIPTKPLNLFVTPEEMNTLVASALFTNWLIVLTLSQLCIIK